MRAARHVPRIRWKRAPSSAVRVAAVVDARGCEASTAACVRSLRDEWTRDGRNARDLDVVVVAGEAALAFEVDALATRVVRGDGAPAAAWTRALETTHGAARDVVALVSGDVVFRPGSVRALLERLQSDPECGAVAPRRFVDAQAVLQARERPRPAPSARLAAACTTRFPFLGAVLARRRRARDATFWGAVEPLATDSLASTCVWLRRKALARTHGLFHAARAGACAHDDLCARLREQGYVLVYEPRAHVQVALAGSRGADETAWGVGADRAGYVRRHGGPFGRWLEACARRVARAVAPPAPRGEDLGRLDAPPVLELGRVVPFVVEFTRAGESEPCAGCVGRGAHVALEAATWDALPAGAWHLRIGDPHGSATWFEARFERGAHATSTPRPPQPTGPTALASSAAPGRPA